MSASNPYFPFRPPSSPGWKEELKAGKEKAFERERGLCHYCAGIANTVDHIIPRSKGGPNAAWNLVAACAPCNTAKWRSMPTCSCEICQAAIEIKRAATCVD